MKQPDFNKLWNECFGGEPKKIRYEIRDGFNFFHDLRFVSSLLHDARIMRSTFELNDETLVIPMNRDCWEFGFTEHDDRKELYICDTALRLKPVHSVEWHFDSNPEPEKDKELWMSHLSVADDFVLIGSNFSDTSNFKLIGEDWKCSVSIDKQEFEIVFEDQEVPYLWSRKRPS